jgi:hypothetical protein
MNGAPKQNLTRICADCPLWPAGTQSGCPTQEKIQLCINHVLGGRRQWITAEEFLAQVAAYRQKRLQEPLKATEPFQPGSFVRTYDLDRLLQYKPKRPVLIIPEDLP